MHTAVTGDRPRRHSRRDPRQKVLVADAVYECVDSFYAFVVKVFFHQQKGHGPDALPYFQPRQGGYVVRQPSQLLGRLNHEINGCHSRFEQRIKVDAILHEQHRI
jgi:hypothetical protein